MIATGESVDILILQINNENENRNIDISVEVPCSIRARCYANFLTHVIEQLYDQFYSNPFLRNAILEPGLPESLIKALDQEVCRYVDKDLGAYRKSQGYKQSSHSEENSQNLTPRATLMQYYHDKADGHESYGIYLTTRFPLLAHLLKRLSQQFEEAITKALMRSDEDQAALKKLFLPNEDYYLSRIISTYNDLHKAGQQVLLLEFELENTAVKSRKVKEPAIIQEENGASTANKGPQQKTIRLIYKPASVLVDMLFLGNTQTLRDSDIDMPRLDSAQSITEIINRAADENAFTPLPSYLIYPREHPNVVDSYGYIEYLPHQPWPENLEKNILAAIAAEQKKLNPNYIAAAQNVIDAQFTNILSETQKKMQRIDSFSCDYIARNEQEHHRYSYQCGVLAAMATAFGITDMHIQNLIVSHIQPYLIDLEVSFNQVEANVKATGFLTRGTGSMLKQPQLHTTLFFLNDIKGLVPVGINIPQKNQFYRLNPNENEPPLRVGPIAAFFNQGFADFMQLLVREKNAFLQWLDHPLVQSMSVRILPYQTSDFMDWMLDYKFKDFQFFLAGKELEELKEKKKIFFNDLEKEEVKDFILERKSEPIFAIFSPSSNLQDNFDSLNIPVFYMRVNEKSLIDSTGNIVMIDYERIAKLCDLEVEALKKQLNLLPENYFPQTPLQFITAQLHKIINDSDYRAGLIAASKTKSQKAFKEQLPENTTQSNAAEIRSENASELTPLFRHRSRQSSQFPDKSDSRCCIIG